MDFLSPLSSRLSTTPLIEISISPQHSSALSEELLSIRLPKIRLHCRLGFNSPEQTKHVLDWDKQLQVIHDYFINVA